MKRLGLLITSSNDLDSVWRLVRAARAKGVKLYIHLTGEGINAVRTPVFQRLCKSAAVTICRQSALQHGLPEVFADLWTGPEQITAMVSRCDRSMIF